MKKTPKQWKKTDEIIKGEDDGTREENYEIIKKRKRWKIIEHKKDDSNDVEWNYEDEELEDGE